MPLTDLYRHEKFKVGVYSGIRYRLFHSILSSLEISTLFIILKNEFTTGYVVHVD